MCGASAVFGLRMYVAPGICTLCKYIVPMACANLAKGVEMCAEYSFFCGGAFMSGNLCKFAALKNKMFSNMKKSLVIVAVACSLLFSSCTFLDNLANNLSSMANLLNCEYSLRNVSNVSVAGVNVKNVAKGNISATDVVMLASAITSKQVPLALNVNIDVKNPTDRSALLTMMDWALDVASNEFATGATNQNYTINAKNTTMVPLGVSTDLYKLFSGTGVEALKTFASSFRQDGTSSQLGLRIRPSVSVAGQTIKTPNYIQIMKPDGTSGTSTSATSTNTNNNNNNTGNTGSNGNTSSSGKKKMKNSVGL